MPALDESRFHEIRATGDLPSPTGVALALLQLTQREDVQIDEIAQVLKADPALSGRLLKFANSPYLGSRRPVVSIVDALLVVGLNVVRQLVLGLSVLSKYRSGRCHRFDYQGFWSRSLATGVAAQVLCAHGRVFPAEEAFTCGLLSGVGQLALATVYPQEYDALIAAAPEAAGQELLGLEQQRFLIDHLELTKAMLQEWGLPGLHVDAVGDLYCSAELGFSGKRSAVLARSLSLGHQLAQVCCGDPGHRAALAPALVETADNLGIGAEDLGSLFDEIAGRWRDWSHILELPASDAPNFADLLDQARQEDKRAPLPLGRDTESGLRIVVADDDETTLQLLDRHLQESGHHVILAREGRDALRLAMENHPQLIIADWQLPGLDGIGICKALRETKIGRRLYIIILAGQDEEDGLVAAFEAGADDYVVKPVHPHLLAARLRAAQRVIRLQREVDRERDENRQYLADLAIANRRLEKAALTDSLTELPNRRYAIRRLEQECAAAQRTGAQLACMIVDIDHFKQINDCHGHSVGDQVLREVAVVLRNAARTDDEVCRIGGEEFLIICANADHRSAQKTAERLREAVEQHQPSLPACDSSLSISIGIAVFPDSSSDPVSLMKAADMAVYSAKREGRNRVCMSAA